MKKPTQPLSACCKAECVFMPSKIKDRLIVMCSFCGAICEVDKPCDIATPSGTIKAQQVSGTSVNISSSKNIPTRNIATPDTEDELEKEIEFIVNPQPELSEMLEGNFTKLFKQLQKDLIRKLIRTEKLKVLEAVKLEKKPVSPDINEENDGVWGYNLAVDDLNAICSNLKK